MTEHDLIESPLSESEVKALAEEVGGIQRLLSTKSPKYRELKGTVTSDADWIAEMAREPRLVRRPLWRTRQGILVGFDPDAWDAVLNSSY